MSFQIPESDPGHIAIYKYAKRMVETIITRRNDGEIDSTVLSICS